MSVEEKAQQKINNTQSTSKAFVANLGNTRAFLGDVLQYTGILLMVGYLGSTVVSITKLPWKAIDELFPTNLQSFPYTVPVGQFETRQTVEMIFSEYNKNKTLENLSRGVAEYIFPLKRTSFPYKSWFLSPEFSGSKGYIVAKWFSMSCANAFCWWRSFYVTLVLLGRWMYEMFGAIADFIIFYIYPYIIIYLIMLPLIPVIGGMLAAFGSTMYNVPGSWIFTFAPVMGVFLAVTNIMSGGIFNIYSWVISCFIFWGGLALGYINLVWWGAVGVALWIYSIVFLFISPIMYEGGIKSFLDTFTDHRKSMLAIFVFLILGSSYRNLNKSLSTGFTVGAVGCLFMIYKMGKPAAPVAVKTPA